VFKRPSAISSTLLVLLALPAPLAAEGMASGSDNPAAVAVGEQLTRLLAQLPQGTDVGLVVADSNSGTSWFAQHPRLPLKPASVMKLFVTAAALEHFGLDFAYETRLYARNGELLVLGSGDPGLGDERIAERHGRPLHGEFDDWAQALKDRGLATLITIALDDSIFDSAGRHPDWPADQAQKWYQAPVGGINFSDNCLEAHFTIADGAVNLVLQPDLPPSFFRNELRVSAKHAPAVSRALDQDVFVFSGTVARDDGLDPISVGHPSVFFGYALRHALEKRGVAVSGPVVRRRLTPAALADAELLDVRTTPLRDVLWRANTFSQNLFAECLLKSLAAYNSDGRRGGTAGSWEGGVRVLEAALQELGLDLHGAVFRDGSGLSHENRVTAQQIVELLITMRRHPYGELFSESLAEPGNDGTMRRRYAVPALEGRLRGKTGTIRGVRALAGYASRTDGVTLAFAVLANGNAPQSLPAQIAEVLVTAGVDTPP
jgi:D-alanyl-D-alanine carboxypeptidase/D-alanyl-D-alanine-endopeptidase (penicillin-binding protein 4)